MLFVIASFLGFMVDEFYIFYCRKYHLVCFLPKINCLWTILCDHNVDLSLSNHIIVALNFYMQYCNNGITWFNRLQKI